MSLATSSQEECDNAVDKYTVLSTPTNSVTAKSCPPLGSTAKEQKPEKCELQNLFFNNFWVLWSHEIHDDDYSLGSYRILWEANNMLDFLLHTNRFAEDDWSTKMFFFMRKGITPRYEDVKNIRGGSWSFRVNKNYSYTSWISLCLQCMGECLIESWNEMRKINGISLSPKNNTTTVRIWSEENNHVLNLQYQIPNIDQHKAIFRPN